MSFNEILENWDNGNRKDVIEELQQMSKMSLFRFCVCCTHGAHYTLQEIERYLALTGKKL